MKIKKIQAAGGVILRHTLNSGLEVFVCERSTKTTSIELPKGRPMYGENIEETAIREVSEETGLKVKILAALGDIRYTFVRFQSQYVNDYDQSILYDKIVHFFLMQSIGGKMENHDREYDRVFWLDWRDAIKILSFRTQVKVILEATSLFVGKR